MSKALYRKYRSKTLEEIVGQEHITQTLAKALASDRVSHAYLFSGPRGVGKTSIARILAHQINGFDYQDDSAYMDIIEIDAASNRRIDEVRDIRDKVYIAPTSGKYKVYIIDEVHMLTREAFNALLKTLEEPPAHAVFILATTESHKLPETIVSRTQHYTFKPVDHDKVVAHLKHIAQTENIMIDDEALSLLAAHGDGSFRDSISLLDQASSLSDSVDKPAIERLLGIAPEHAVKQLIDMISTGAGPGAVMQQLSSLYGQGLQAASLARQLTARLRQGLTDNSPLLADGHDLRLMRQLIDVPASHNPERLLEIVLIEAASFGSMSAMDSMPAFNTATVQTSVQATQAPATGPIASSAPVQNLAPHPASQAASARQTHQPQPLDQPFVVVPPPAPEPVASVAPTVSVVAGPEIARALDDHSWPDILNSIKKEYNTLYGVLRMAKPVYGQDSIELQFKFAFHQKRLNEAKNRQIIANFIKQTTGQDVGVQCTLYRPAVEAPVAMAASTPEIGSITDIFGGGEVIGS